MTCPNSWFTCVLSRFSTVWEAQEKQGTGKITTIVPSVCRSKSMRKIAFLFYSDIRCICIHIYICVCVYVSWYIFNLFPVNVPLSPSQKLDQATARQRFVLWGLTLGIVNDWLVATRFRESPISLNASRLWKDAAEWCQLLGCVGL